MAGRRLSVLLAALAIVGLLSPATAQDSHTVYSDSEIEAGAQLYGVHCVACHGVNGDAVGTSKLAAGQYRRAANDQELRLLIQNGVPNAGMPAQKISTAEIGAVVAYLYNMRTYKRPAPTAEGNAERGKILFAGKGACTDCHRVTGVGAATGPDLSDIGRQRNDGYLKNVLLDPSPVMMPIHRPVTIMMKNGRDIRGRRLNEDTYSVQIVDSSGRLRSVDKSEMRKYTVGTESAMPSFKDKLTAQEISDIVAYLMSLKG